MSEYERERQKRIEENRKMLEELFPDGTSLSLPVRRAPEKEETPDSKDGDSSYGSPITPRTRARSPHFSLSLPLLFNFITLF